MMRVLPFEMEVKKGSIENSAAAAAESLFSHRLEAPVSQT